MFLHTSVSRRFLGCIWILRDSWEFFSFSGILKVSLVSPALLVFFQFLRDSSVSSVSWGFLVIPEESCGIPGRYVEKILGRIMGILEGSWGFERYLNDRSGFCGILNELLLDLNILRKVATCM